MKLCNRISLACLFWISACAGYAKTRDLQQLNAKPRKLEQGLQQDEQTIQDSKKQLANVEASHNTHGSPLVSPTPQASTVPAPQLATEYIDHRTLTREELLSSSEKPTFFRRQPGYANNHGHPQFAVWSRRVGGETLSTFMPI